MFAQVGYKDGHCGVNMLSGFKDPENATDEVYCACPIYYGLKRIETDILKSTVGEGCQWLQVGYIENKHSPIETDKSKKVYDILKKRFPIVFESEKRLNKNSANIFWFVIYDLSKEYK